jgi:hypothetical protein
VSTVIGHVDVSVSGVYGDMARFDEAPDTNPETCRTREIKLAKNQVRGGSRFQGGEVSPGQDTTVQSINHINVDFGITLV